MAISDAESFKKSCEYFERELAANPRNASLWQSWATALQQRAVSTFGDEMEQLYAQAEEKYAQAQLLKLDDPTLAYNFARMLLERAYRVRAEDARRSLIRAVGLCQRVVKICVGSSQWDTEMRRLANYLCGSALFVLGTRSAYPDADQLFAAAEEKFAAALSPLDPAPQVAMASAVCLRAFQHGGEAGRPFFARSRELYEAVLSRNPSYTEAMAGVAESLFWEAVRLPDQEADGIFAEVEVRCRAGLRLNPNDERMIGRLVSATVNRAYMRTGDEQRECLVRASEVMNSFRGVSVRGLTARAEVLELRSQVIPGEETNRLIEEAHRECEAVAEKAANPSEVLHCHGTLLFARADIDGMESLRAAKQKYLEAVAHVPDRVAYDLGCVCARLGEEEECRHWLVKSREPGVCVSRGRMMRDRDLASVRDRDWFRSLMG
jgi:hypothetical protein